MKSALRYFLNPALKTWAGRLLLLLVAIDLSLSLTYLLVLDNTSDALTAMFHLDFEENVPATYSAVKLIFAGLAVFACISVDRGRRFAGRLLSYRDMWLIIGMILVLMGVDEYNSYHEGFGKLLYDWGIVAQGKHTIAGYAWPWTVYGALFALAVGIPAALFTRKAFARHRYLFRLLLLAGFLFVAGALGFENIRVYLVSFHESIGANVFMVMEELCEMLAVSLVVFVFLRYREERLMEHASSSEDAIQSLISSSESAA
jgi:hypothetical protein